MFDSSFLTNPNQSSQFQMPLWRTSGAVDPMQFSSGGAMGGLAAPQSPTGWSWFDKTDASGIKTQGMAAPALGVATGAFNAWMGMKQYGLAKSQLAEGKQQFNMNYDAQRTTTNAQLQDRQRARVASNPGAYQSVGDYMGANGIRPRG